MATDNLTDGIKDGLIKEGLPESDVVNNYAISWLDTDKVLFLTRTRVSVNDKWYSVGNDQTQEFMNNQDDVEKLKTSVPEPFSTAILTVWGKNSG
jgi:hypothetical protein